MEHHDRKEKTPYLIKNSKFNVDADVDVDVYVDVGVGS